ncbi:MAG: translation initiation factor IF-6 [Thermoprotei archaeon]
MIERVKLFNTDAIGVFARASDSAVFVPLNTAWRLKKVFGGREMDINVVELGLGGIVAVGAMIVANNMGVILPYNVDEEDVRRVKAAGFNFARSNTKLNALGNLVVANSKVGFVSPRLTASTVKLVEDTLGVEVVSTTVAGLQTVGSSLALNNRGFACHPLATEEEFRLISEVSGLRGRRVTVNSGYPYIRSGIIYNDHFVLMGYSSTGIEMAELSSALGVE